MTRTHPGLKSKAERRAPIISARRKTLTPFAFGSPCPKLMSSHQRGLFPRASAKLLSSLSQPAVGVSHVRLSDGAVLKLKILIVDVKEAGF
jgi:hypothetical protein